MKHNEIKIHQPYVKDKRIYRRELTENRQKYPLSKLENRRQQQQQQKSFIKEIK
jgi:hypothetical protein